MTKQLAATRCLFVENLLLILFYNQVDILDLWPIAYTDQETGKEYRFIANAHYLKASCCLSQIPIHAWQVNVSNSSGIADEPV